MDGDSQKELLTFLRETVGDDLQAVSWYDSETYDVLYESPFFDEFLREVTDKTREEVHEDLRLKRMKANLDSELYSADVYCQVAVTEVAIAYHLILDEENGLYVSVSPEADVPFPSFIHECADIVTESSDCAAWTPGQESVTCDAASGER